MGDPSTSLLTVIAVESIVLGVLAALFAAVWWRGRGPGMGWLVAGFGLASAWYFNSESLPPGGPSITHPVERVWSIVIGAAVLCVATGVVRHVRPPAGPLRWLVWVWLLPGLALLVALAAGVEVLHVTYHFGVMAAYLGAALLALARGVRSQDDGHLLIGVALLILALLPPVMAQLGLDPQQLKYLAGVSLAVFGMVMLTVWLLRRQSELLAEVQRRTAAEAGLRDVNARLEARVAERTSHLRELVEGLQTFNRGVSHDLRGPLGGMSNLARLAADQLSQGDASLAQRALAAIAEQCDASVRMVQAMLDLALIGDAPARRDRCNLQALLSGAIDEALLASPGRERPLVAAEVPADLVCDPELLRRAVVNLVANALKFTRDAPRPRIEVRGRVDGQAVLIEVADNGVGFSPDQATHLFEPFFRGHDASFGGHGLGLSIVRRCVEAMGGRAWAEGRPGQGATLCLRLPDALPTVPATAEPVPLAGAAH